MLIVNLCTEGSLEDKANVALLLHSDLIVTYIAINLYIRVCVCICNVYIYTNIYIKEKRSSIYSYTAPFNMKSQESPFCFPEAVFLPPVNMAP